MPCLELKEEKMKFRLIIDKGCEEEIIAKVHSASELTEKIENIVLAHCGNNSILVQGDYEMLDMNFSDIECIAVIDRRLVVIDSAGEMHRTAGNLSELEAKLPSYFVRINKSAIANERKIVCYKATFSGGVDAVFKSGYKDYVSRRCLSEIKRRKK